MKKFLYSKDVNVQMLLYLLKINHIKKVVVSPGTMNVLIIASMQQDGYFEMYSAVDERGAAYIACGLAAESKEAVVLSCTGATASRNYFPGLTEAYYRKLPILAITSAQSETKQGDLSPQYIDRSQQPKDTVRLSVQLQTINSDEDIRDCNKKINRAILELFRKGGGPVHINIPTDYRGTLTEKNLSPTRVINRYTIYDKMPEIDAGKKIAIHVGYHGKWDEKLINAVERFCEQYNAVVLVEHSSRYTGKYRIFPTILSAQEMHDSECFKIDLLLHLGETIGDVYLRQRLMNVKEVWRISEDGEIKDPFYKLTKVFEMKEETFFESFLQINKVEKKKDYFDTFSEEIRNVYNKLPTFPLSSIWIAKEMSDKMPNNSVIHIGIGNVMRAFNFFDFTNVKSIMSNTGAWGIDGALSTGIGMSLASPDNLQYIILGDLAFFYDINALGNRHVNSNVRVMIINNGKGAEMRIYQSCVERDLGDEADLFLAGGKHFGNQSKDLIKHYAQDLGFMYLSASSKDEFNKNMSLFLQSKKLDKPMIFEVFTNSEDENEALIKMRYIVKDDKYKGKEMVKKVLGKRGMQVALTVKKRL